MDNYEQNYNFHNNENQSHNKYHSQREKGALVPITANIINKAEITQDEAIKFQGIILMDVIAVGYVVDYKETDSKLILIIYDYTGLIEINFFIKIDNESIGFDNFIYEGKREPVQILGTLKVIRGQKIIKGAKLIKTSCNNVLYHKANVIHSWLYLTGKLNELKENQVQNSAQEAKMIAMENNNNNGYGYNNMKNTPVKNSGDRDIKKKGKIEELFGKFGNKIKDIINKLIENNRLIENDGEYEICL